MIVKFLTQLNGTWLDVPEDGISWSVAGSKCRLNYPVKQFKNCRYQWSDGTNVGSFYPVILQ